MLNDSPKMLTLSAIGAEESKRYIKKGLFEVIREFCRKEFIKENIKESLERLVYIHK